MVIVKIVSNHVFGRGLGALSICSPDAVRSRSDLGPDADLRVFAVQPASCWWAKTTCV